MSQNQGYKSRLLNSWIDSCVDYAEETEPPKQFKIWSAIATISSVLERKCYITWGIEGRLYPNMYVVLCGPSAARKGTAMKKVGKLLKVLERDKKVKIIPDSCSREKLIQIVAGSLKGEADEAHCSVTVYATELTVFIDKQAGVIINDLNKLYDCEEDFKYETKHQGEDHCHNVYVTLFAATTPSHIQTDFPQIATSGGFTSRVVFVFGDKKDKKVPLPVFSTKLLELEKKLAFDLSTIHSLRGEFYMTKEFLEAYEQWYMTHEKTCTLPDKHFEGYMGRRGDHIRKLSMIFSASRGNSMRIEKQDFEEARKLLVYTEQFMPFVFQGHGRCHGSHVIQSLLKSVNDANGLWVPLEEVFKHHIYDATWDEMLKYADTLKHAGEYSYRLNKDNAKPELARKKEFCEMDKYPWKEEGKK